MSGVLLDTHILLWWLADDEKLPKRFLYIIADADIPCFVSAATIWEIGIKRALGKLDAPANLVGIVQDEGFHLISITAEHAEAAAALPPHHRDPFDRMLIAQAVIEDLRIATVDARFSDYDAPLMPETQHK
jgi:PIN domain nuclease of toxin-antitoxin system